ncbi:MAG: PKD domain-containing protein [Alphaproteobacteria bacterium]|nr:PKD domain-containing protein [Alphaproteobacteria bacterium]
MHRLALLPIATLLALGLGCDSLQPVQGAFPGDTGLDVGNPVNPGVDTDTDGTDTLPTTGANNPPRANAGPDQRDVAPNALLTLDGSGSSDIDGDALDYTWQVVRQAPGSNPQLVNETFPTADITCDLPGTYEVKLTVSDGSAENSDTMVITVVQGNHAPIANAGTDQRVDVNDIVTLNGSGSSDPDGDTLSYDWSFVSRPPGSGATLNGISIPQAAVTPTFLADMSGIFTLKLVVSDGELDSQPDLVTITVNASTPPTTGGGSSSSSDCLSCAAHVDGVVGGGQWSAGGMASSFGILVLPMFLALYHRRRDDE